uniref:Uncharacterized protein n=1 Tax=Trichobilharzia regenti TaxID=157069 RepID=A0AA85JZ64_TRIRE|nr:unnamed protein product [Trichobilharzia regenti]
MFMTEISIFTFDGLLKSLGYLNFLCIKMHGFYSVSHCFNLLITIVNRGLYSLTIRSRFLPTAVRFLKELEEEHYGVVALEKNISSDNEFSIIILFYDSMQSVYTLL